MPTYRATRFINTREATTYDFDAATDEEAREVILDGDNLDWSDDSDLLEADVADEVIGLDRRNDDGSYETVDDGIDLPSSMPYGAPSQEFVRKVAALLTFREAVAGDENPEAAQIDLDTLTGDHDTLETLIVEARKLCGTQA